MINRNLIRVRVLQIFFAWSQKEVKDMKKAEDELMLSLQKSYDLYHYLLQLLIELTDEYERRIEQRKAKLLPSDEDKNPNTKLVNNLFISQLRNNIDLQNYLQERPFDWQADESFIKDTLNLILCSDIYSDYACDEIQSYESDREFWKKAFKKFIVANEDLCILLEEECIYWNDDIEIVESFVLKTIKQFEEQNGDKQRLLPMFRDEEDEAFAKKLLKETIFNAKDNGIRIDRYASNWESERITQMDLATMQIALAEIQFFPTIPVNVTINEYINISKNYSTPKSFSFINGVLDSIVKEMRENNQIIKD